MMPGIQLEEIRDAFTDAFDEDSLAEMMRLRVGRKLANLVNTKSAFPTLVFNLLEKADQQGWDVVLVKEAYRYSPGNRQLRAVYEKYGLAPEIALSTAGAPVAGGSPAASGGAFEKIIQQGNPFLDIGKLISRLAELEVRVCRVDLDGAPQGTGFLVGPGVVLTNYHVMEPLLKGTATAKSFACRFDHKVLADGSIQQGLPVLLHSDGVLAHSPYTPEEYAGNPDKALPSESQLDYALLRLERDLGSEHLSTPESPRRGWETLPAAAPQYKPDQGIIIVQHPRGIPMKIAIDTNSVVGVNGNGTRVRYRTNTEGGSSGSPVLSMEGSLLALHHYGDPAYGHPKYNQGIAPLNVIRTQIVAAGHGALLG